MLNLMPDFLRWLPMPDENASSMIALLYPVLWALLIFSPLFLLYSGIKWMVKKDKQMLVVFFGSLFILIYSAAFLYG